MEKKNNKRIKIEGVAFILKKWLKIHCRYPQKNFFFFNFVF